MKEVCVAKLDKEDLALFKELEESKKETDILIANAFSKYQAFWMHLRKKHNLDILGQTHYIKDKAIYKGVI